MRLSDIMGNAGLAFYAEVGFIIFLAAFIAIVVHTFRREAKADHESASRIPLDDYVPVHERGEGGKAESSSDQD